MVAANAKWGWQLLKQPAAVMRYVRGPTVHGATCARHASAESAPDTLVSETDAENWDATRKLADDGRRYSGLNWSARTLLRAV